MRDYTPSIRLTQRLRSMLLRQAFSLLYNEFAWAYDWVSHTFFRGEWRDWQRAAIPPLAGIPGPHVLELGFGTGNLQADLHAAGYQPYGIDQSAAMLRIAGRKARRGDPATGLRLVRAAAQALPFPAAAFDGVVSTFPSEYIYDPHSIQEIDRVLRPGGRLVVVPAATLLPIDRTSSALDRFADLVYGRPAPRRGSRAMRRQQILDAFGRAEAFGPLVPNLRAAGFRVAVLTATRPTSIALIVVADKPA